MNKWEFLKENYIDKGLKIFPIVPNGKTPLIEKWQEDCSCDFFQVLYWFNECPDCNWALPCTPNNLFVLDLDRHDPNKDGVENFSNLLEKVLDDTEYNNFHWTNCTQRTPSGGEHYIFKTDDDLKNVSNNSNVFQEYPGIDIRTDGYILVEPSVINDKEYRYTTINSLNNQSVLPRNMPLQLKLYILANAKSKNDIKKQPYEKPKVVEKGDRDNQLYSYINNVYYKTRLDFDEILCLANHFNETILEEPFPERIVKYKVRKVFEKDREKMVFVNLIE